jgi:hypothetical protein
MFSITIAVPQDVITAGSVAVALYGQLLQSYGQFSSGQWVYYDGTDYAAVGDSVPSYTTISTAGTTTLNLPCDAYFSGAFIFGIGVLPVIPVTSNAPSEPVPIAVPGIYDVIELTYNVDGSIFTNTTAVDQFGIPIQLQIGPANANLPNGVGTGVATSRSGVLSGFSNYAGSTSPFLQCAQDLFGNSVTSRLTSTGFTMTGNCVQGVTANAFAEKSSLTAGLTYFYAVTAVGSGSQESYAQFNIAGATTSSSESAVMVAWSPNEQQPAGIVSYNVYRGTLASGTFAWNGLLANVPASQFGPGIGCNYPDTGGTPVNENAPPIDPLDTYFDGELTALFANDSITLAATDGTSDGYVYTVTGGSAVTGNLPVLQFLLTGVVDSDNNPVADPPIPLQTPFNVYSPFWSTNTYALSTTSAPDWFTGGDLLVPPSVMVFNNDGVFSDSADQPVPAGVDAGLYATILGALENQLVSALMRGIANSSTIAPLNWGNGTAPIQTSPALMDTPGTLVPGTTYYYVITAVNGNGESVGSLEFNATPTTALPSVALNWLPMQTWQATSFNVYRGTASQQENTLLQSVANPNGTTSTIVDTGAAGTSQQPPMYYPQNGVWDAYAAYLHQPSVSLNGAVYAFAYDDQGNQSSELADDAPTSMSMTLGPWS